MNFGEYLIERWPDLLGLVAVHVLIVLVSVAISAVVAVGLGILIENRSRAGGIGAVFSGPLLPATAALLTVPSLALFALLIPLFGLGTGPSVVALALYGLYPIMRNTVTGLRGIDRAAADVAKGMGLNPAQQLFRVRLPLAWPVILNGVRVATIMIVAIAAIAAAVSGPGLGTLIFTGLTELGGANALNDALAGTVGVAVVALILDALFILLARLTTSRGIRA